MTGPRRPWFQDGERLTASRLNDAFSAGDDAVRRARLATVGAGVAAGLQLGLSGFGPGARLRVEAGVAFDGAGRVLVVGAAQEVTRAEIEEQVGPLVVGARVLVQVRSTEAAGSSTDPCVGLRPQVVDCHPVLAFSLGQGARRAAVLAAWSELGGAANELTVTLGSVRHEPGGLSASMEERQGLALRADALDDTLGRPIVTLRGDGGGAAVRFLAPTSGDDVTATQLGYGVVRTAGFAPSDARVLVAHGGAGPVGPGLAGTTAVPVELDLSGGVVDRAGVPLELAEATAGSAAVRARRAGTPPSSLALGLSAAGAYAVGAATVVPVATAGLVEVRVRAGDAGVPLGAWLRPAGEGELAIVSRGTAMVVARAAQRSEQRGGVVTLLAWVHPAQPMTVDPDAPLVG